MNPNNTYFSPSGIWLRIEVKAVIHALSSRKLLSARNFLELPNVSTIEWYTTKEETLAVG